MHQRGGSMTTETVIRVISTSEGMPAATRNWKRQGVSSGSWPCTPFHETDGELLASKTMRINVMIQATRFMVTC